MWENQLVSIGLLAVSVLLVCIFILTASGLFPSDRSLSERYGEIGALCVFAALAVIFMLAIHAAFFAFEHTAWYFAVMASGLALLASPAIHEVLPGTIRDGVAGVFVFGICGLVMHIALVAL